MASGKKYDEVSEELKRYYMSHRGQYQARDWHVLDYDLQGIEGVPFPIRGPVSNRVRKGQYFVVLGSAASFGCRVEQSYSQLTAQNFGIPCVNFSKAGASPEAYLEEGMARVFEIIKSAAFVVIEVMAARSVSNSRFRTHGGRGGADDELTGRKKVRVVGEMIGPPPNRVGILA